MGHTVSRDKLLNNKIRTITSYEHNLSESDEEFIHLICNSTSLIELNVRLVGANYKLKESLGKIIKLNSSITSLTLSRVGYMTEHITGTLSTNTVLRTLKLPMGNITVDVRKIVEELLINTTLTHLDLKYNLMKPNQTENIARLLLYNTTLSKLNLRRNSLDSESLVTLANALTKNSTLLSLDISQNDMENEDYLAITTAMLQNETLASLKFGGRLVTLFNDGPLIRMVECNSTLAKLELNGFYLKSFELHKVLFESLSKHQFLCSVRFKRCMLSPNIFRYIAPIYTLPVLKLSNISDIGDENFLHIITITHLSTLSIRSCQVSDIGVEALAPLLRTNSTLTKLDLRKNDIVGTCLPNLAAALTVNSTLTSLKLTGNPITDLTALTEMHAYNPYLTVHAFDVPHITTRSNERMQNVANLSRMRDSSPITMFNLRNEHNLRMKTLTLFDRLLFASNPPLFVEKK